MALGKELQNTGQTWVDAFRLTPEVRIERTLRQWDRGLGQPPGSLAKLVRSLNEHVPPNEVIQLIEVRDRRHARALVPLPHLCFPRRLRADLFPLPENWEPEEESYLLVFDRAVDARLEGRKTCLARGVGWSLRH